MSVELNYLVWVTVLTMLMWIPYIVNMIMVRGLLDAVGYPEDPKPLAPWAERMKAAHYNAVENLVVFAPLVLVIEALEAGNGATALACAVYFWARLAHAAVYTLGIPFARTLAFAVAFFAQIALVLQLV